MTIENIYRVMSNLSYLPHIGMNIFILIKKIETPGVYREGRVVWNIPPNPRKIGGGFNRVGSQPSPLSPRKRLPVKIKKMPKKFRPP